MRARTITILLAALLAFAVGQEIINKHGNNLEEETEEEEPEEASGEVATKRGDSMFPNIGYLFKGYNIIAGNPMDPDRFDPGFASPIFKAEFEKGRTTADQSYKVPDNADIIAKSACSDSVTVETINTESQYQQDLLAKASASASGQIKAVEASFTASTEYSRMSKQLKSNTKSVIKNEASCVVYEARIQTGTPPPVTDNFKAFVRRMASEENYPEFLDTFGTHFVEYVDMGARFTKLDQMSKKTQEDLQKEGFNLKMAAEASIVGLGSASTSSEFDMTTEDTKKYQESIESTKVVTIGSKLPEDGNKEAWRKQTIERPMPIHYSLRSITELFNGKYFSIDDVDVRTVGAKLLNALQGYCKVLKTDRFPNAECEGPPKGCGGGSQCSINAKCTDNSESENEDHLYNCVCNKGFKGDGKLCQRELLGVPTVALHIDENMYDYGTWGGMDVCTNGAFSSGFTLKVAKEEGGGDDTAANAICLMCDETEERCSKKGLWGDWSEPFKCPKGSYLTGWRQNVEADKGWGLLADDTAMNNVEYECRDLETWEETKKLEGNGFQWGTWSRYKRCPRGQFICGINTRVAPHYHDDTALTDVEHKCCRPEFSAKKMTRMFAMMSQKRKAQKMKKMKEMKSAKEE